MELFTSRTSLESTSLELLQCINVTQAMFWMATPGGEVINTKFSHLVLKMCHARVCSEHGLWSGDAPECSPINCGAPLSLDNGVVSLLNDSTHLGSLVAYHCREDFILNTTSDKGEVHHYINHRATSNIH